MTESSTTVTASDGTTVDVPFAEIVDISFLSADDRESDRSAVMIDVGETGREIELIGGRDLYHVLGARWMAWRESMPTLWAQPPDCTPDEVLVLPRDNSVPFKEILTVKFLPAARHITGLCAVSIARPPLSDIVLVGENNQMTKVWYLEILDRWDTWTIAMGELEYPLAGTPDEMYDAMTGNWHGESTDRWGLWGRARRIRDRESSRGADTSPVMPAEPAVSPDILNLPYFSILFAEIASVQVLFTDASPSRAIFIRTFSGEDVVRLGEARGEDTLAQYKEICREWNAWKLRDAAAPVSADRHLLSPGPSDDLGPSDPSGSEMTVLSSIDEWVSGLGSMGAIAVDPLPVANPAAITWSATLEIDETKLNQGHQYDVAWVFARLGVTDMVDLVDAVLLYRDDEWVIRVFGSDPCRHVPDMAVSLDGEFKVFIESRELVMHASISEADDALVVDRPDLAGLTLFTRLGAPHAYPGREAWPEGAIVYKDVILASVGQARTYEQPSNS